MFACFATCACRCNLCLQMQRLESRYPQCEKGSSTEVAGLRRWAKLRLVEQCDHDEEEKNTKITKNVLLIEVKCSPVCSPPPQYKDLCLNKPHVESFSTNVGWMRMMDGHSYQWKLPHTVLCLLEYRYNLLLQNNALCVFITRILSQPLHVSWFSICY